MTRAIDRYYRVQGMDIDKLSRIKQDLKTTTAKQEKRTTIGEKVSEESGPVIQIVDQILLQCASTGASDIHIEPYESFLSGPSSSRWLSYRKLRGHQANSGYP